MHRRRAGTHAKTVAAKGSGIWRLAGLLLGGALLGLLFEQPLLGVTLALAVYCCLLILDARRLQDWLREHRTDTPQLLTRHHDNIAGEITSLQRQHKQREERLSQFIKRIQQATAALPDAIIILNQYDEIEWANHQALDYLGIRWPRIPSHSLWRQSAAAGRPRYQPDTLYKPDAA